MEETEESASDWAHFPSESCKNDVPSEIIASTSMPSSSSQIFTETHSVSQDGNETRGKQEALSEQLVEGGRSLVQFPSQSSAEEDVGRNDVVTESHSESNGDVGPSTSNGRLQVHYRDHEDGFFSHFGSSSRYPALPSSVVPIKLFVIAPKSVEDVTIRPQKVMVTELHAFGLLVNCLNVDWNWKRLEFEISKGSLVSEFREPVMVQFTN